MPRDQRRAPRSKNGQPAQSTTGVASTNCTSAEAVWESGAKPKCAPISSTTTGSGQRGGNPQPPRHVGEFAAVIGAAVFGLQRHAADRAGAGAGPGGFRDASGRCRSCRAGGGGRGLRGRGMEIFAGIGDEFACGSRRRRRNTHGRRARWRCAAVAGSTFIPQTGSVTCFGRRQHRMHHDNTLETGTR